MFAHCLPMCQAANRRRAPVGMGILRLSATAWQQTSSDYLWHQYAWHTWT